MKRAASILLTLVLPLLIASGLRAQDGGQGQGQGQEPPRPPRPEGEGPRPDGERPPRQGGFGPGGGGGSGRPGGFLMAMPVHAALDIDKNGEISGEELSQAVELLKALDKNADGKLTEEELRPNFGGRGPGGGGFGGRGQGGPGGWPKAGR